MNRPEEHTVFRERDIFCLNLSPGMLSGSMWHSHINGVFVNTHIVCFRGIWGPKRGVAGLRGCWVRWNLLVEMKNLTFCPFTSVQVQLLLGGWMWTDKTLQRRDFASLVLWHEKGVVCQPLWGVWAATFCCLSCSGGLWDVVVINAFQLKPFGWSVLRICTFGWNYLTTMRT